MFGGFWLQYNLAFYLQYLAKWPEYFEVLEAPGGQLMSYIMGKAEGFHGMGRDHESWHGHVTAVTVAPEYRRLGLAEKLMNSLEVHKHVCKQACRCVCKFVCKHVSKPCKHV